MNDGDKTTMEECISVLDHCIDELFTLYGFDKSGEYSLFTNGYIIRPMPKKYVEVGIWQNNHKLPD